MKIIEILSSVLAEQLQAENTRIRFIQKAIKAKKGNSKTHNHRIAIHQQNIFDLKSSLIFLNSVKGIMNDVKERDNPLKDIIIQQLNRNGLYWNDR